MNIFKTTLLISIITLFSGVSNAQFGPPLGLQITEQQRQCLEAKLGKPDPSHRPSREIMEAAFKACGLEWNDLDTDQNISPEALFNSLNNLYKNAKTDEEKTQIKEAIKSIFYATQSNDLKDKIRKFFKENRDTSSSPITQKESSAVTGAM
jgi:hypothetical protein